ncbi:phosphotransferase family protein [Microbacterium thalassium]|uniref:Aminoglycoside/choline kinase family phosphotransferase n=1 Tax=Microbacterium thalassium TaxID=362649 RepID=A0A7X0FN18_9MICO|nr:phosphotransferase [Microbacterium thalassium]MBB6390519.1 aminoglycoside/choline kinase family phosphotransferase [Microbacterium thalassium]GLK25630.1 hypothetical protein GCM10017607_29490 [Microbacterium thalassium]
MDISELDREWLAGALGVESHRLSDPVAARLGQGQVGDTYTVDFEKDGVPTRLVLKLTAHDADSAEAAHQENNYLREVRFYQDLARELHIRVPEVHHAVISDDGKRFALLMEDLAPCSTRDQIAGCSAAEAEAVVMEVAKLHGQMWQREELHALDWLPGPREIPEEVLPFLPAMFGAFCERFEGRLAPEVVEIGRAFFEDFAAYLTAQNSAPTTLQHGDFRADNLLFDVRDGTDRLAVVDWQTIQRGPGVLDVAYFLGGSLDPTDRRAIERPLLEAYHARLVDYGVDGYSFEACWADYARFAFHGLFIGVGAAMTVEQTDRGDELFVSMVQRAAQHAIDLDSLAHLRGDRARV